jgi:hypothetical protein
VALSALRPPANTPGCPATGERWGEATLEVKRTLYGANGQRCLLVVPLELKVA